MKFHIAVFISSFLFTGPILFGQVINIPDSIFKSKLIAFGVDKDSDGEINFEEN